jgi:hypothetical protein
MKLEPRPSNDFAEFMDLYYQACSAKVPQIEAMAAKWDFEDLLPGLSDYDTRFIYANNMTVDDWCRMSMAVGQVHLDICRQHPKWSRILEHLPGINITWNELTDPKLYYSEYKQWTFYRTKKPLVLESAQKMLDDVVWSQEDEYFHLKKFILYYGRYNRTIDPAVNCGPFTNKYLLHSRFMHYFAPPVQSAISIITRTNIRGKAEALRLAAELFPELDIFDETLDIVNNKHYEVPYLYEEENLIKLEDRLESALKVIAVRLAKVLTLFDNACSKEVTTWKLYLKNVISSPAISIFENAKFARQMKGRLYFYINAPAHFDNQWVIENEINRINHLLFVAPFGTFWQIKTLQNADPANVLDGFRNFGFTGEEIEAARIFNKLTRPPVAGKHKDIAVNLLPIYDAFFHGLHRVMETSKVVPASAARG